MFDKSQNVEYKMNIVGSYRYTGHKRTVILHIMSNDEYNNQDTITVTLLNEGC